MDPAACQSVLAKLKAIYQVPAGQELSWGQLVNSLEPNMNTAELFVEGVTVTAGNMGLGVLSDAEKAILRGIHGRRFLDIPDAFQITCVSIPAILEQPESSPPGSDDEASSDEEGSDEESGETVAPATTAPAPSLLPPSTTLPAPMGGGFVLPPPTLGGGGGGGAFVLPTFGSQVPPLLAPAPTPAPTLPAPTLGGGGGLVLPGPTQPAPLPDGADLPYVTVWVKGLKPREESRVVVFNLTEPDGNVIKFHMFVTAGNVPEMFARTFFQNENYDAANNPQMAAIHAQNNKTIKDSGNNTPVNLSDGVRPDGICAQKLQGYVAELKMEKPRECPAGSNNKPKSNRAIQAPAGTTLPAGFTLGGQPSQPLPLFGTQPTVPAPVSGGTAVPSAPTSGPLASRGLPLDPVTGQIVPPPPGTQMVKIVNFDKPDGNQANGIDAYWIPGGARPIALTTTGQSRWTWYALPTGEIVRSLERTLGLNQGDKMTRSKLGVNQEQKLAQVKAIITAWYGPNYYQPFGVAGAVAPGQTGTGTTALAPVTQPNPFAGQGTGAMIGSLLTATQQPATALQPASVFPPVATQPFQPLGTGAGMFPVTVQPQVPQTNPPGGLTPATQPLLAQPVQTQQPQTNGLGAIPGLLPATQPLQQTQPPLMGSVVPSAQTGFMGLGNLFGASGTAVPK